MAKLGDIATYINGYPFKPEDWSDKGVPIIRIQDLSGNSYQTNRYNGKYASKYEVNDGDVLISWSASLGVYIWHGEKAVLNQHIFKVVFDKAEVDKSFFVHQVGEILEKAASSAHGATMKHLTKPVFDALPFYLPPIEEQRRIATILDKVTDLLAQRRAQLDKLDLLVKSRFAQLFGEYKKYKQLDKYALLITKGASPKWQGVEYCDEGVLFVTSENVREGYLDLSKKKYLDDKINIIQPRSVLKRDDILINIVGASIGRAAIYNREDVANINQAVALVRVDYSSINQTFLITYLNSPQVIELYTKMKKGGARDNLSLKNISDLPIPVVPINIQNQFAAFVEQIEKSKLTINKSLDKLEMIKKALMQNYFG